MKLNNSQGSVGEKAYQGKLLTFGAIRVFSSIMRAFYCTVKFDVGKHDLGGSAMNSQRNVAKFHTARRLVTL